MRGLELIELLYNIFKIEYNSWEKNSTEEVWNRNRFLVCEIITKPQKHAVLLFCEKMKKLEFFSCAFSNLVIIC